MARIFRAETLNRAKVDFIKIDLETAITFAKTARESSHPEKTAGNRQNARKGYDTVIHLLRTATLTQVERENIATKLEWLKAALSDLGETSPQQRSK